MAALGQKRTLGRLRAMSALPPKPDIGTHSRNVRFVPKADMRRSFGTINLLTAYARQRHALDRRWVPLAGERLRVRRVKPHQQVELAFWGREPVGFLVCARTFILEI